ncbi:hypothetical protein QFC21_001191 [Naganishia friedmannii]|uniref:Uncharacterized protein n=1 Tax=Naganishia friedmannii TaxID=89922 RepID=A0ACC2W9J3_9TREE|nr:hypothetical protein QFC21_001191 [Naganishia friedmannii]
MPASYWPFNALPLPSFSRASSATPSSTSMLSPASARGTSPTLSSFPFFFSSPPELSTSGTPSTFPHDVTSRGPLTPDQVMEMEEQDLFVVDRALMDFAAGTVDHDTAWISKEKDIRVNALWVHPIKSCRGVSLQKSVVTPQGLQYDRQWAIREVETEQMCTAREHPSMVLITSEIDEANNLLQVTFPAETSLPGFAVRLQAEDAEVRMSATIMHKKLLPPSYLPAFIPIPGTISADGFFPSPDEQLSTYFSKPVQFIQKSPFIEDIRTLAPPPVSKEMKANDQNGDWLTTDDLEYGLAKINGVKQERGAETGYADGYPVLLANEESFKNVQSSLDTAVYTPSDPTFGNLGPSFNKDAWRSKTLDIRRFRANVILGRGDESGEELDAWEEERWREVEFWGEEKEEMHDDVQIMNSSNEQDQDMEMTEVPADAKLSTLLMSGGKQSRTVKRGGMICVSRCGRCQLPNVNPETAEADKAVPYKLLAKYRRVDPAQKFTPIFGVNAVPQQSYGAIHVGDRVRVKKMNNWEVLGVASKN